MTFTAPIGSAAGVAPAPLTPQQTREAWLRRLLQDPHSALCAALRALPAPDGTHVALTPFLALHSPVATGYGLAGDAFVEALRDTFDVLYPGSSGRARQWVEGRMTQNAMVCAALRGHAFQVAPIQIIEQFLLGAVATAEAQRYHLGRDVLLDLLLTAFDRLFPGQRRAYLEATPWDNRTEQVFIASR